jgi:hypothetical protein
VAPVPLPRPAARKSELREQLPRLFALSAGLGVPVERKVEATLPTSAWSRSAAGREKGTAEDPVVTFAPRSKGLRAQGGFQFPTRERT